MTSIARAERPRGGSPAPADGSAHLHDAAGGTHLHLRTAAYAALVLRLALGAVFVAHALLKLLVFTLPGTAAFFTAHGFPGWTAYPVFAAELAGGLALIAGVGVRAVALALVPVMLGALAVHWPNGWSFTAPNGGWEYVAFLIAALVAQAGLGAGALAPRRAIGAGAREGEARPAVGRLP